MRDGYATNPVIRIHQAPGIRRAPPDFDGTRRRLTECLSLPLVVSFDAGHFQFRDAGPIDRDDPRLDLATPLGFLWRGFAIQSPGA